MAVVVLLLMGVQARAQVAPAGVAVEMGAWRFTPVVAEGQPASVLGFLALMDPGVAEGQNITAVWYAAPIGGGGWLKTAWQGESEWAVIELLKTQVGIAAGSDGDWETWQERPVPAPAAASPGEAYEGGFFVSDGLGQAVNTLANRDDIVALLVELGYAGADLPGESSEVETCRRDLVLDAMAHGVATELAAGTGGAAAMNDMVATCLAVICLPSTVYGPVTCQPWLCGPWVMVDGAGSPGPPPPPAGGYPSGPGTNICYYSRTATRVCWRTFTKTGMLCGVTTGTEFQACSGKQGGRATVERGLLCPGEPDNANATQCSPDSFTCGPWR